MLRPPLQHDAGGHSLRSRSPEEPTARKGRSGSSPRLSTDNGALASSNTWVALLTLNASQINSSAEPSTRSHARLMQAKCTYF